MDGIRYPLLLLTLLMGSWAQAQTPLKSVDEQGNVTYSDQPVPDAVKTEAVPVQPGPSEEEVKAARERIEKTEEMADEARKAREAREKEREEARRAAEAAKPEVVIIKEESGGYYPEYRNPPLITPGRPTNPIHRPNPSRPKPEHPAYRPPGASPPTARPPVATPPTILPVPR